MHDDRLFSSYDLIAVVLALAAAASAVALRFRQPLILAFIAIGVLVGPSGFGWAEETQRIGFLADLGLALLLFVVGLRLDLHLVRSSGPVVLVTGLALVLLTTALGYGISAAMGARPLSALYVGLALSNSSTVVVVKLLSDRNETESLHGRIAIGVLIVQDLCMVLAMVILGGATGGSGPELIVRILALLAKGVALLVGVWVLSFAVMPRLLGYVAQSPELLTLSGLAWAIGLAHISSDLGLSREMGAFLAGVSLASAPYRELLGARLSGLRDFLLLFLFVKLGIGLDLRSLGSWAWAALPLSFLTMAGKPLIIMSTAALVGYRKRTAFLAGVSLGQASEFSLILAGIGLALGHLDSSTFSVIALVGLATIGISSYLIAHSHGLYRRFSPYLGVFDRQVRHPEDDQDAQRTARPPDVLLFGLGRYGTAMAGHLIGRGHRVLGVDFDPQAVRRWNERGWAGRFGDAEDPDFTSTLPLDDVRWVISSVRERDASMTLMQSLRSHGYRGSTAVTAGDADEVDSLAIAGADIVFNPFLDAASQAIDLVETADQQEIRRKMDNLIASLKDHYVVCGYGRMGQQIVRDLQRSNVPYVVVEWNPEQVPKLTQNQVPFVEGRATEDKTLIWAGIERAKGLVAVTVTDEENVFIVLTARALNPNLFIVARSIQQENEDKLRKAGADKVMSPYILSGRQMAETILRPHLAEFIDLVVHSGSDGIEIREVEVAQSAQIAGKSLRDSAIRSSTGASVVAIARSGKMHPNPSPDFVVEPADHLVLIGSPDQVDAAVRLAE